MDPVTLALILNGVIKGIDYVVELNKGQGQLPEEFIVARTEVRRLLTESMRPTDTPPTTPT